MGSYVAGGAKLFDQLFHKRPGGAGRSGRDIGSWRSARTKAEGLMGNDEWLDAVIGRLKKSGSRYGLGEWDTETGQFGRGEAGLRLNQRTDHRIGSGIHYDASTEEADRARALFSQLVAAAESRYASQGRMETDIAESVSSRMESRTKFLESLVEKKQLEMAERHTRGLT